MSFLYFLKTLRFPLLNYVMLAITKLGDESIFLVVALVMFWCINKQYGYYLMGVGCAGIVPNQLLKVLCRVPRPWLLDPNFTAVEQALRDAEGFSFPSGHAQSAIGTYGCIASVYQDKRIRIPALVLCVLIPLSRMYLGVHTPTDVLFSVFFGLILLFAFRPMAKGTVAPYLVFLSVLSIAAAAFVSLYPFPAELAPEDLAHSVKNIYDLTGAVLGILAVYYLDSRFLQFSVKAPLGFQFFKAMAGIALLLGAKALLKLPITALLGDAPLGETLRYFLVVVTAGFGWPWIFTAILNKKEGNCK